MISINGTSVENIASGNRFERSKLEWMIYNAPATYADLILNGELQKYLNAVMVYRSFES